MTTTEALQQQKPLGDTLEDQMARLDRHGYLFGQKITHSLSPFLHQIIYDHLGLKWSQIRLDSADMSQFLHLAQHPSFYGESSTLPLAKKQKPKKGRDVTNKSHRGLRHHAQQSRHPVAPG